MAMMMRGVLWLQLYLLVCLAPLVFALVGDRPPGRSFATDLSAALGFVGLALLGLQFVITARLPHVAAPYGMDLMVAFHRKMSVVAFSFILAHPALLIAVDLATLELFNPITAPWRARFAVASLLGLIFLVVSSIYRKRLNLGYELWKVLHGVVSVLVVITALVHVYLVDYYVSTPIKQVLWALMTLSFMGVLGYTRLVQPIRSLRRPWVVDEVREERGDAYTLRLRPDGHEGITFQPGQFVWIRVKCSPFAVQEHPFTISSSAEGNGAIECTIKALGDWTSEVHEIELGARAYVDGPYGAFSPDRSEGAGYVMIAGGIGITPMVSMLRTLADRDDRRPVLLVYADSNAEGLALREEIDELQGRLDLQVVYALQDTSDSSTLAGEIHEGFVDVDLLERWVPEKSRARRQYFICGPPPMMDAVEEALEDIGVPLERINTERFDFA